MKRIIDNKNITKCNSCNTYFTYEDEDIINITSHYENGNYSYEDICLVVECPKCGYKYKIWDTKEWFKDE